MINARSILGAAAGPSLGRHLLVLVILGQQIKVRHRTAVCYPSLTRKAETTGNCRPGRGCMRSQRLPISSILKDSTFPGVHVSGEMLFPAREYRPKGYLGPICSKDPRHAQGHAQGRSTARRDRRDRRDRCGPRSFAAGKK